MGKERPHILWKEVARRKKRREHACAPPAKGGHSRNGDLGEMMLEREKI